MVTSQSQTELLPALLRPVEAAKYLGVSRRQVYCLADSDPSFPRKIIISPRCVAFRRVDLDCWLERKARCEI